MPITKSAEKALRSSKRKRVFNMARKEAVRKAEKAVRQIAGGKNGEEAKETLKAAYKAIDKALKRGVLKKNTAARRKSRLSKILKNSGQKA